MRLGLSQDQQQALRSGPDVMPPPTGAPTTKEIPYDYVARFVLTGTPSTRLQDVINISIEGAFVAVSIGYSVILPKKDQNTGSIPSIDFKYSIIDSGSGRELQNRPIHNIAGLGDATGRRPFRPLAKPMLFMPRSTIRIEVEEITNDITKDAELFIVFHGYKMLGYGMG